jgi:hypothetical protein
LKSLSVPINGSIAVSYYGETSSFTGNDFQNGTFENWANQVLAQYQNISPCAQIVGVTTAVNISQSTVLNTIGILNSLSALADIAGTTNILGGATTTVSGSTNNNNKQNKNGNNSNNNSGGDVSASGSNGTSTTNPNPSTNPSGTTSTSTTSNSGSTQQANGTSSTGSGENGGTTSSPGTEGGTGSQNPTSSTTEPSIESSSSTTTGTPGGGNTENPSTPSGTEETGSTGSTTGNGSGSGSSEPQTQETPTTQEESGQTNITGGSTNTIKGSTTTSSSSKSKEGGKPSVVASALKGPNVTGFYALLKPKVVTILSGTLTIGFEGIGSLYGTISGGQMFSFQKVKNLKVIYMATVSYGAVFRTQFLGTAVIAGGMYDLKIGKRIDIKLTNLMVYSPYVSYYNDLVLASPFVMLPSVGTNIGITKKFKFNINAGGAWSLGNSTLNYTITCGTRLMVGQ